jgi:hypothetical protein
MRHRKTTQKKDLAEIKVKFKASTFLTPAVDGDEWSVSRSGRFISKENSPGTYWLGGCVGPRPDPDAVE